MNSELNTLHTMCERPWQTAWAMRVPIIYGFAIGLIVALFLVLTLPKTWQASMTVSPAGQGGGADLSAFVPQADTPALQYFLQRVNAVTAADFSAYETLMTGTRVAASLQKDDSVKANLKNLCKNCEKDSAKLSHWLRNHVRIQAIGNTRLRRISLRATDRVFAPDMLRALHRLTDETIRLDQRIRTDQRISYLRDALANTANPDHRDALVALLQEQERIRMMVGIDYDFAAAAIDPPMLAHRPIFPNPVVFLPLWAMLGALAGAAYGVWRQCRK